MNGIEREVPIGKIVHVILDNYGAHKQALVPVALHAGCYCDEHAEERFRYARFHR